MYYAVKVGQCLGMAMATDFMTLQLCKISAKWVYLTKCTPSRYIHVPTRIDRVHICTQSYTTGYIYVPSRIRQSTYMYPLVHGRVHICTQSYTTAYICVLCRVRPCVYIFANFDPYQFNLRTQDLTRIYPSWLTKRSYAFDHGQFPWWDRPPRAVRSYRGNGGIVRAWTMDVTSAMPVNSFRSWA